ncbi:MAG: TonB-dependent receptor [Pedobacter sp.]|nr:TonB-dependent receptor [Pedobacter sp.]
MVKIILRHCLPIIILLFASKTFAQQHAALKGKILTVDGSPAANITVSVKGQNAFVISNTNGEYEFKKLKSGTFKISVFGVGLKSATITVTLRDHETSIADFTLIESSDELKEVLISGFRKKYKVDEPAPSLRLNTPLLEVPQNIQIVNASTLSDQQVLSMSDGVLRNVSGASRLEHWGDLYTNVLMRGSQVQAFRNGFNVVSSFWGPLTEDMSFVDHIEVVKGPAGFMLSNGDPSGLYNVVTKKPTGITKGEVNMTFGSFDLFRTALDLDGKLTSDSRVLYRLNMAAQNKKSFRPNEFNNRYTFAPVLSFQLDAKTKLTAEYTLQYAKMSDVGSYYVFSPEGYATLPRDFGSVPPNLDPTKITDHSAFLNLEHKFDEHWKVTAQASYFNYSQKGTSMWPADVLADGKMIRSVGIWDAKSEMTMGQVFLNGDVKTGLIRHRLLTGIDLGSKDYLADWGQTHALDTAGAAFDPGNPVYTAPANGYPNFDRSSSLKARAELAGGLINQKYRGFYLQDELGFLDNSFRLTLAGRYTYVKQASFGAAAVSAKHFSPRIGLSISLDKQLSVYGLYDQAFIPQGGKMASGGSVQPIIGNNLEAGLKKDWFGGKMNTTFSVYRIFKNNELTADPNSPPNSGLSVELGQRRSQGFEFDMRGEVLPGLNATANYAYTDSKVTKVTENVTGIEVGDPVPGFSKHTINTWLGYKIQSGALTGVGVSGGFSYLIDRATSNFSVSNREQNLPDYFKLDAGVFWENNKLKVTGNVFNVLDKYLYSGSYYTNYFSTPVYEWQAEAPRNYRLSIAYKF